MNHVNSPKDNVVEVREISFSGIMKAADVQLVTSLSRVSIWRLEKEKKFPARVQAGPSRVGWHGHEIEAWINGRPRVDTERYEREEITA